MASHSAGEERFPPLGTRARSPSDRNAAGATASGGGGIPNRRGNDSGRGGSVDRAGVLRKGRQTGPSAAAPLPRRRPRRVIPPAPRRQLFLVGDAAEDPVAALLGGAGVHNVGTAPAAAAAAGGNSSNGNYINNRTASEVQALRAGASIVLDAGGIAFRGGRPTGGGVAFFYATSPGVQRPASASPRRPSVDETNAAGASAPAASPPTTTAAAGAVSNDNISVINSNDRSNAAATNNAATAWTAPESHPKTGATVTPPGKSAGVAKQLRARRRDQLRFLKRLSRQYYEPVELQVESLTRVVAQVIFLLFYLTVVACIVVQVIPQAQWGVVNVCGRTHATRLRRLDRWSSGACMAQAPSATDPTGSGATDVTWTSGTDLGFLRNRLRLYRRVIVSVPRPADQMGKTVRYPIEVAVTTISPAGGGGGGGPAPPAPYTTTFATELTCHEKNDRCDVLRLGEEMIFMRPTDTGDETLQVTLLGLPASIASRIDSGGGGGSTTAACGVVYQKWAYTLGSLVWRYVFMLLSLLHVLRFVACRRYTSTLYEQSWVIILQVALFWYLNPISALIVVSQPLPTVLAFLEFRMPTYFITIVIAYMFSVMTASMYWTRKATAPPATVAESKKTDEASESTRRAKKNSSSGGGGGVCSHSRSSSSSTLSSLSSNNSASNSSEDDENNISTNTTTTPGTVLEAQPPRPRRQSRRTQLQRVWDDLFTSPNVYDPPVWTKLTTILYIIAVFILDIIDAATAVTDWSHGSNSGSHFHGLYWAVIALLLFGAVVCLGMLLYVRDYLGSKPYLESRAQQLACRVFIRVFAITLLYYIIHCFVFFFLYNRDFTAVRSCTPFLQLPALMIATGFTNVMTLVYTTHSRGEGVPIHPSDRRWKFMVWPDTWYRWLARHGGSQYVFFTEEEETSFYKIQFEFRKRQYLAKVKRLRTQRAAVAARARGNINSAGQRGRGTGSRFQSCSGRFDRSGAYDHDDGEHCDDDHDDNSWMSDGMAASAFGGVGIGGMPRSRALSRTGSSTPPSPLLDAAAAPPPTSANPNNHNIKKKTSGAASSGGRDYETGNHLGEDNDDSSGGDNLRRAPAEYRTPQNSGSPAQLLSTCERAAPFGTAASGVALSTINHQQPQQPQQHHQHQCKKSGGGGRGNALHQAASGGEKNSDDDDDDDDNDVSTLQHARTMNAADMRALTRDVNHEYDINSNNKRVHVRTGSADGLGGRRNTNAVAIPHTMDITARRRAQDDLALPTSAAWRKDYTASQQQSRRQRQQEQDAAMAKVYGNSILNMDRFSTFYLADGRDGDEDGDGGDEDGGETSKDHPTGGGGGVANSLARTWGGGPSPRGASPAGGAGDGHLDGTSGASPRLLQQQQHGGHEDPAEASVFRVEGPAKRRSRLQQQQQQYHQPQRSQCQLVRSARSLDDSGPLSPGVSRNGSLRLATTAVSGCGGGGHGSLPLSPSVAPDGTLRRHGRSLSGSLYPTPFDLAFHAVSARSGGGGGGANNVDVSLYVANDDGGSGSGPLVTLRAYEQFLPDYTIDADLAAARSKKRLLAAAAAKSNGRGQGSYKAPGAAVLALKKAKDRLTAFFSGAERAVLDQPIRSLDRLEVDVFDAAAKPFDRGLRYLPFFNLETAVDCYNLSWEAYGVEESAGDATMETGIAVDARNVPRVAAHFLSGCCRSGGSEDSSQNGGSEVDGNDDANGDNGEGGGDDGSRDPSRDVRGGGAAGEEAQMETLVPVTPAADYDSETGSGGDAAPPLVATAPAGGDVAATEVSVPILQRTAEHGNDASSIASNDPNTGAAAGNALEAVDGGGADTPSEAHPSSAPDEVRRVAAAAVADTGLLPINVRKYGYHLLYVKEIKDVQVIIAIMDTTAPEHRGKAPRIIISFRGTANMSNAKYDMNMHRVVWKEMETPLPKRGGGGSNNSIDGDNDGGSSIVSTVASAVNMAYIGCASCCRSILDKTGFRPTCHAGFLAIWRAMRPRVIGKLVRILKSDPDTVYRVFTTGHSLGGAEAALCAYSAYRALLKMNYPIPDITVYTYGQPRLGNGAFKRIYDKAVPRSFRIMNESDMVVTFTMFGGVHVGIEVNVDRNGNYIIKPTEMERMFKPTKGRGMSLLNHLMKNYGASLNAIVAATACPARALGCYTTADPAKIRMEREMDELIEAKAKERARREKEDKERAAKE